jgi:diguanylate cyclase (GGDEF)-like protein/PAS domain S-box-containing protein
MPFGLYKLGRVATGELGKFLTNDIVNDPQIMDHQWARDLGLVSFAGYKLQDSSRKPVGVLGLFSKQPITAEEDSLLEGLASTSGHIIQSWKAREALQKSQSHFRTLIETAASIIISLSTDGQILEFNHEAERVYGCKKEEALGRNYFELFLPHEEQDKVIENFKNVLSGKPSRGFENIVKSAYGERFYFSWSIERIIDSKGISIGAVAIGQDITRRKKAEEKILQERDKLLNILDSMEDGVYIVNQGYDIEYINPVLKKEFGPTAGRKCYDYFHDRQEVCPWCKNKDVMEGKTVHWEWHSPKNQKTYDLMDTPLKNPDGSISKLEIFRDITDRKEMEKNLEKVATVDVLTGAFNRSKFDEIIKREMERAIRFDQLLSLIMFDIDHFKEINDTYGHLAGDNVLRKIADIVRENMRKIDYFVRWGGEEFIIIAPQTDLKRALALSERIRRVTADNKFEKTGKVTLSFGLTEFQKSDSMDTFIKRADEAMYQAKNNGRNRIEII